MKIAISTIYNDDFKEIAALTVPVMQEYCLRHGYTFLATHSKAVGSAIVWERLVPVQMLFQTHEHVVHMDADCLITNLEKRIEDILGDRGQCVATSENGIINDGVFIWGTLKWLYALRQEEMLEVFSSPQDALNQKYGSTMDIKHVPSRTTNSVLNAECDLENPATEWQQGDFILHLPGIGNLRRIEILKQFIPQIQR